MDALKKIQQELKAPKGQYNSFGKYKYRSAEDILEAVKPLLGKFDALLTLSDEIIEVGGRIYVKAIATFQSGGDTVIVTAFAREPDEKKGMDDSQITGTASSYARKYALNGLFLIDDTKDADTDEYRKQTEGKQTEDKPKKPTKKTEQSTSDDVKSGVPKINQTTVDIIESFIVKTNSDKAGLLKYYRVDDVRDMSQEQARHCLGILQQRLKDNGQI